MYQEPIQECVKPQNTKKIINMKEMRDRLVVAGTKVCNKIKIETKASMWMVILKRRKRLLKIVGWMVISILKCLNSKNALLAILEEISHRNTFLN